MTAEHERRRDDLLGEKERLVQEEADLVHRLVSVVFLFIYKVAHSHEYLNSDCNGDLLPHRGKIE